MVTVAALVPTQGRVSAPCKSSQLSDFGGWVVQSAPPYLFVSAPIRILGEMVEQDAVEYRSPRA